MARKPRSDRRFGVTREELERRMTPPDEYGCRLWIGRVRPTGYAMIYVGQGRYRFVHRVAHELFIGPIPEGKHVAHDCMTFGAPEDRKTCLVHLKALTPQEHTHDAVAKGQQRHLSGDDHPFRKHPELVARGERHGSRTHPERVPRGDRHGTHTKPDAYPKGDRHYSRLEPWRLARGERHGLAVHPEAIRRGSANGHSRFTEEDIRAIRALASNGVSQHEIGRRYNAAQGTIGTIVRGEVWKHLL